MSNLTLEYLRLRFAEIMKEHKIPDGLVSVKAKALTPEEAIGNPEHDDYPIQKGRERLMEARYMKGSGVAFTDMFGDFTGTLADILKMELTNNYRRAIVASTMNAVLNDLGLVEKTSHCKDQGPSKCGRQVADWIDRFIHQKSFEPILKEVEKRNYQSDSSSEAAKHPLRIFLVGMQPRLLEGLSERYQVRITDMDEKNIGSTVNGVTVESDEAGADALEWCDLIMATGTTLVNDTAGPLLDSGKPLVLYGVTCAAASWILGIPRYCPEGF